MKLPSYSIIQHFYANQWRSDTRRGLGGFLSEIYAKKTPFWGKMQKLPEIRGSCRKKQKHLRARQKTNRNIRGNPQNVQKFAPYQFQFFSLNLCLFAMICSIWRTCLLEYFPFLKRVSFFLSFPFLRFLLCGSLRGIAIESIL